MIAEILIQDATLDISNLTGRPEFVLDDGSIIVSGEDKPTIEVISPSFDLLVDSNPGLPPDGTSGYILAKKSNVSFDVQWVPHTKITVGLTPPTSPSVGDLWVDTN